MKDYGKIVTIALYGTIQAVLAIPVMYGYAAIVFADPIYTAFMPSLAKLMLLSSFVHGVCFCVRSNIPFAIGQVQDAGLIFLSKIASDIAIRMKGESASSVVATSLVTIALCTATLGGVLILIGRVRLAKLVAYLPMPVIGGYLAFIGYFCLEAGMSLASGEVINGLSSWTTLVSEDRTIILCAPALVSGAALTYISRYYTHFAALPLAIISLPASFYGLLYFSGCSFDDARAYGWLGATTEPADSLEIFNLYDFSAVHWSVIPYQLPVWSAMVVVVAFSSCLDVAAIEMDMGTALDTNAELMTVGSSNLISGILGGFTGSYIFSQTIFGYRSGCHLRSVAAVMLVLEIIVFGLKVDPLAYVPLFFFAATLIFIAIDLMLEWLIEVRVKLSGREYLIVLSTFGAINIIGLNPGLFFGVCLSVVDFVFTYAIRTSRVESNMVTKIERQSLALRHPSQMRCLKDNQAAILTFALHGSAFFGSSVDILNTISKHMNLEESGSLRRNTTSNGGDSTVEMSPVSTEESPLLPPNATRASSYGKEGTRMVMPVRVRFVVLDCTHLQGVDATAARSCFRQLQNTASLHDIHLCYAGLNSRTLALLQAHGAISEPVSKAFPSLYAALDWCETSLLNELAGHTDPVDTCYGDAETGYTAEGVTTALIRRSSLRKLPVLTVPLVCKTILGLTDDQCEELECLKNYYSIMTLEMDDFLFRKGDEAAEFYVLLEGEVVFETAPFGTNIAKSIIFQKGAFLGFVDIQLLSVRKFYARAVSKCTLAVFSGGSLIRMMEDNPQALVRVMQVMIKQCSLEVMS